MVVDVPELDVPELDVRVLDVLVLGVLVLDVRVLDVLAVVDHELEEGEKLWTDPREVQVE